MTKNTKKSGVLRFFIYFDKKKKEFVGVCLELGIITCGENPYFVEKDLLESARGYVATICKKNLTDQLLNQSPPKEYIEIFEKFLRISSGKAIEQNTSFFDEARTFLKTVPELCPAI